MIVPCACACACACVCACALSRWSWFHYRVYLMEKYRDFFGMKEELESSGVSALELHTYELMLQERADIFPTAMNKEAAVVAQGARELDLTGDMS